MKKFIFLLILLLISANIYAATLYTPNGKCFQTYDGNWPSYNSGDFEAWKNNNFGPGTLYPNSYVIGTWEDNIWEYNCHVFAWNNWQGADRWDSESDMWTLGKPSPTDLMWRSSPDVWYTDSDNPIGIVSYISSASNEAAICTYSGNHSARIVGDGTRCISKWGYRGIVNHPEEETSYGSVNAYYKINPAYRPIGDGDPAGRDWETITNALSGITSGSLISILSGTQSLSENISIPSGVELEIQSGTTINLNGYTITKGAGGIVLESGALVNPHYCVKTGSTINGFYPSLNSAIANASSGQTVEVQTNTTLANNILVPSGVTLRIKSGITLNSYTVTKASSGLIIHVYTNLYS